MSQPAIEWVKDTLLRYADLPVVPVRYVGDDKVPLKGWDWGRWKDGGQSEEEKRRALELFERGECDGLAVVCGVKVEGRGYFFTIDIDLPFDEAVGKIEPTTRFEKTLRGRLHAYYFSQRPVPTKTVGALELKGYGSLTVVYPSRGYEKMNDNLGCQVEDGFALFRKIAGAFGYDLDEHLAKESGGDVVDFSLLSGWLNDVIIELERRGLKPRRGPNYYSCLCPFHEEKQPSFAINHRRFYAVDYHDGKVYNMKELAKALGVEVEKVSEKEKPKGKSVLSLSLPMRGLVLEAVGVPNGLNSYDPKLLVLGPQGFEMHDFLLVDGVELRPRSPRSYPYMPYVVEDFTVKSRAELVELVRAEVDKFVDAEPEEKAIFTGLIILSYCQELFETVPYLYLVGDNSSGKSHLLQLFNHLCYRPLFGVSLTHADIYSYLEDDGLPLTILEDEFQGSEKDNEKMKVYKAGYKKDARVPRVVLFEGGRRVDYFNCFGLKAFAAEQLVENKGFLERCIVVELVEGYPEKDHYESEDLKRFAWLRGELLKWRMYVLAGREIMPKLEFDWLKGRDRELYLPLLTLLEGTALYPLLERTLFARVEERKKEKAASLEASVCRVVKRLMDLGKELSFVDIWLELCNDLGASLEYRPGSQISDAMNSEAYGRITKKQLSTILRDKLGMNRLRPRKEGKRIIIYTPNPSKLAKAFRKYGIDGPDGHGGHGGHGCSSIAPLENPAKKA